MSRDARVSYHSDHCFSSFRPELGYHTTDPTTNPPSNAQAACLSNRPCIQASTPRIPWRGYCSVKYQGFLFPYASPGTCIGTGTIPSNSFKSPSPVPELIRRTGTITPHSQLRQLSLGSFVARSLESLPHALSEQLADPI